MEADHITTPTENSKPSNERVMQPSSVGQGDCDDYPDCSCLAQKRWPKTFSFADILPPIQQEVARSVGAMNALLALLRDRHDTPGSPPFTSTEALDAFSACRRDMLHSLDITTAMIKETPGYFCGRLSPHHRSISMHLAELCAMEEDCMNNVGQVQEYTPLVEAIAIDMEKLRRRQHLQTVIRTTGILVLPHFPFLSAICTLYDFFAFSLPYAFAKRTMQELEDDFNRVRAKLERMKGLVKQHAEMVARARAYLERLQAEREEWERLHPDSIKLGEVMDCVYATKRALRGALFPRPNTEHGPCKDSSSSASSPSTQASLRVICAAYRALGEVLDAPDIVSGLLASMTNEELDRFDSFLSTFKEMVNC